MKRGLSLLVALLLTGCTLTRPAAEPPLVSHSYAPSADVLLNPERGFFTPYELPAPAGFSTVRDTGNTLVHANIRLDRWREADLPPDLLEGLAQNFADMREAGVKVILRFAYNNGPYPDSQPDASKTQILTHLAQLTPLLQDNADVIAWVEAGFIGAWGEWHTSTHGLDNITDKKEILLALLDALPATRMVQVRYPTNIIDIYPGVLTSTQAFDQSDQARVGHHNDCFLATDDDMGTYNRDGSNTILTDQAYLAELTRFTPMSGETCAVNPPRSACESALKEMELLHFTAINEAYHKQVLRGWDKGGCLPEIAARLGYRFTLSQSEFNEQVRPGGTLNLRVSLTNSGFGSLINPRPVFIVLKNADAQYSVSLALDPRHWEPGDGSFEVALHIPANAPAGTYTLALWLPDDSPALRMNPDFAIHFANEDIWDGVTGANILGSIQVDRSAAGARRSGNDFTVLQLSTPGLH
jgi:hypothetical protein